MIDPAAPERSLLLRKPLATVAGGTGHEGVDELGRNVYQSKVEPGYLVLQRWVLGQAAPPGPRRSREGSRTMRSHNRAR